jgi:hypothetical protein
MPARVTAKLITSRIRAVQAAGLTVVAVQADGTVLTALPESRDPVPVSARGDDECRRLFLRDAS